MTAFGLGYEDRMLTDAEVRETVMRGQAQRDYFGAHTYERTDKPGVFHTEWTK